MADEPGRVYWDANVLLSYLNGVPDRAPIIEELLRLAVRHNKAGHKPDLVIAVRLTSGPVFNYAPDELDLATPLDGVLNDAP